MTFSVPRGLTLVLLGLAALALGRALDGWASAFLAGAALMLLFLGAAVAGLARARVGWLPSRDDRR